MVATTSSVAALLVVVSSIDFILAFHPYSMIAKTISSLDSRTLGLSQIASASSPIIRRDNVFTLSYLRTADNNVDYIQEFVKETNDIATEIETKPMYTSSSITTGYKTIETLDIDAELEYITQRNLLLAGDIETMERNVLLAGGIITMEATFWRLFQQEGENDREFNPDFLLTDEEFIDSVAIMLLERPARTRTGQTCSPALSVTAASYL